MQVVDVVEQESIVLRDHAHGASLRCGVVVPRHSALGGSLPATGPNADTVASPREVLATELAGPAKALLTRGILLGIKRRVECQLQAETAAAVASSHRHRVV